MGLEEGGDLAELADIEETLGRAEPDEGLPAFGLEVVDLVRVDDATVAVGEVEKNSVRGRGHGERREDLSFWR